MSPRRWKSWVASTRRWPAWKTPRGSSRGHRGVLGSRVALLTQAMRTQEAVAAAYQGLALYPEDPDLHWNLALAHLLHGEFQQGWREHEWRLRVPSLRHKVLQVDAPPWAGESLAGRALLLHGEQGFGDSIQFFRLLPRVAAGAGTVFLRVDATLHRLLRAALPGNVHMLAADAPLPAVSCHASLMSLAAILALREEEFARDVPYLRADPAAVQDWCARIGDGGLKVGLAWSGNPTHANDHNRSISLNAFRGLTVQGCRFFSLQPQLREADRELLAGWRGMTDLGRTLRDFADTAALIEALDLVITVDTSVAHLAGALGKPVWILLAHVPDWRWMLKRMDSPWYPSARLFRQPVAGDWEPVLAEVRGALLQRQGSAPH